MRYLPRKEFDDLFKGKTGHDLHRLERSAALRRYLTASGNHALLTQPEWGKMGGRRPYSLRYGVETVTVNEAKHQVWFAVKLADLVLQEKS
ncbi:MAG: hypothetical protein HY735_29745 [Verrucomicrobia bacterium]|nr:hypothetical protein [Verrucomicrobiota bacterium]